MFNRPAKKAQRHTLGGAFGQRRSSGGVTRSPGRLTAHFESSGSGKKSRNPHANSNSKVIEDTNPFDISNDLSVGQKKQQPQMSSHLKQFYERKTMPSVEL